MNKNGFIKKLSEQTGYEYEKCNLINDIVEDTFIIGRKSKEIMIGKFEEQLKCDQVEANKIYETVMDIIGSEIKNKLKHPFGTND